MIYFPLLYFSNPKISRPTSYRTQEAARRVGWIDLLEDFN